MDEEGADINADDMECFVTVDQIEKWLINLRDERVSKTSSYKLDYSSPDLVGLSYSLADLEALPTTAKEAKEKGVTRYFGGTFCRDMHVSPRLLTGVCECCHKIRRLRYYKKNRRSLLEQAVKNNRERYHTDPVFKAKRMARAMVERALRVSFKKKDERTRDYLDYSPEELKEHCLKYLSEKMFLSSGLWHLDHVIPISLFDTSLDGWIACANSLENLVPLSIEDHKLKTRRDMTLISDVKAGRVPNPSEVFYNEWRMSRPK